MLAVAGRLRYDTADLRPAQDRQVQVQDDDVGRLLRNRAERGVSARNDLNLSVPCPLQRVFDEPGNIVLVLDDEDARRPVHHRLRSVRGRSADACGVTWRDVHAMPVSLSPRSFRAVTLRLIVGYAEIWVTSFRRSAFGVRRSAFGVRRSAFEQLSQKSDCRLRPSSPDPRPPTVLASLPHSFHPRRRRPRQQRAGEHDRDEDERSRPRLPVPVFVG